MWLRSQWTVGYEGAHLSTYLCFVLNFIILFKFSMICQDFRVYFNTQMSSSKISHTNLSYLHIHYIIWQILLSRSEINTLLQYDWPPDTAHIRTLQPQHYLRLQIWGSICISDRHSLHQIFLGLEKIESSAVIVDWQGSRSDNDKRQSALCQVQSSPLSSECVMRREVGRLVRRERGLYTQSGSLNTLVTQGSNLENSDN